MGYQSLVHLWPFKKKLSLQTSVFIIFRHSRFYVWNRAKLEFPSSTRELILSSIRKFQKVIKSSPGGLETLIFFVEILQMDKRFNPSAILAHLMPKSMQKKIPKLMWILGINFFSTIYILGAPGGTLRKKKSPKMAPGASKWSNLKLRTLFGDCYVLKPSILRSESFGWWLRLPTN